jgi:hypothetical protein
MIRVKDIPEAKRWMMATKVLTRLVVALGRDPGGPTDVTTFKDGLFSEMSSEIGAIADRYGMPRENASDLVQTLGAISVILFGPEFETRYIEGFPDESVIRLTECAMFREESSKGIAPPEVNRVCQAYVQHAIKALNPGFSISIPRARCRGDSFCEMVIERKNI